ncbi:MAG: helix-turn-helix domain-containing protein [Chloroflexota bacterium]|nr:helix-turn-helix domain-containing protein [Chloroflexota bacterium]
MSGAMTDQGATNGRGFCRVDNAIIDEYGAAIGPYGIAVYLVLLRCSDADAYAFPSYSYIAERTGMSMRKVASVVKQLAALGLIEIADRRTHSSNGYTLRPLHQVHTHMHDVHTHMHDVHDAESHNHASHAYPMHQVHTDLHDVHDPHAPGASDPCTTCMPPMHEVHANNTQLTRPNDQDPGDPVCFVGGSPPTHTDPAGSAESQPPAESNAAGWSRFLNSLAWVCYGHGDLDALTKAQLGALTAEAKRMFAAGYRRDDLQIWLDEHWRPQWAGRKAQTGTYPRPRPDQVRSGIPALRDKRAELAELTARGGALQPRRPPPPADDPDDPAYVVRRAISGIANIDLSDAGVAVAGDATTITLPASRVEYARRQYTRSIVFALRSAGLPYNVEFAAKPELVPA